MKLKTIYILIGSIIFTLAGVGAIVYEVSSIMSHQDSRTAIKAQVVDEVNRTTSLNALKKVVNGIDHKKAIIDSYIVSSENSIGFIEKMESFAKDQNLAININSVNTKSDNGTKTIDMAFTVKGSWTDIMHFMRIIDVSPFALTINSASFSVADAAKKQWQASVRISVAAKD